MNMNIKKRVADSTSLARPGQIHNIMKTNFQQILQSKNFFKHPNRCDGTSGDPSKGGKESRCLRKLSVSLRLQLERNYVDILKKNSKRNFTKLDPKTRIHNNSVNVEIKANSLVPHTEEGIDRKHYLFSKKAREISNEVKLLKTQHRIKRRLHNISPDCSNQHLPSRDNSINEGKNVSDVRKEVESIKDFDKIKSRRYPEVSFKLVNNPGSNPRKPISKRYINNTKLYIQEYGNGTLLSPHHPHTKKDLTPIKNQKKKTEFSTDFRSIRKSSPDSFYNYFKNNAETKNYKNLQIKHKIFAEGSNSGNIEAIPKPLVDDTNNISSNLPISHFRY
ncbi:unnamed protein product [Moneuplotes crassus]|uniref:Uncharacterized protein n=1 Tax=Euplotes crassus TaxID=5936 RepID=A0AAD1XR61_EUPCR|nr:unnamed protein product [Moneuplotes crassus]